MQPDSHVHIVEYLTTSPANSPQGETVVITIRPDPDSFRPHNLALLKPAAERLLADLQKSLARISLFLLLPLIADGGCSGHVEVSTETRSPSETTEGVEKFNTQVSLSLLTDGDEPSPLLPYPEPTEPPETEEEAVKITGDGNVVVAIEGDIHFHEHRHEHLHIETASEPKRRKAKPKWIKVEVYKPKVDPECERLRREHEKRVERWMAVMGR